MAEHGVTYADWLSAFCAGFIACDNGLTEGPEAFMQAAAAAYEARGERAAVSKFPRLSTGEAFRAVNTALCDPGHYTSRIMRFGGTDEREPMERWQTRAVMCAVDKLEPRP